MFLRYSRVGVRKTSWGWPAVWNNLVPNEQTLLLEDKLVMCTGARTATWRSTSRARRRSTSTTSPTTSSAVGPTFSFSGLESYFTKAAARNVEFLCIFYFTWLTGRKGIKTEIVWCGFETPPPPSPPARPRDAMGLFTVTSVSKWTSFLSLQNEKFWEIFSSREVRVGGKVKKFNKLKPYTIFSRSNIWRFYTVKTSLYCGQNHQHVHS
jgi:hypothetical protein